MRSTKKNQTPSLLITDIAWGRMVVEGVGDGRDFKLWPGGGRPWDWSETGTHHVPGIQPADVQELLENNCQTIVLSQGMLRRLQTCQETLDLLESQGISVHIAETNEAVEIYNELVRRKKAVGGLFHSTC